MKFLLPVICLVLMMKAVSAQQLQVQAGLNLSGSASGNSFGASNGSVLPGIRLGMAAEFPVGRFAGIQPGLFLYQCGGRFPLLPDDQQTEGGTGTLRLNYLQVPILVTGCFRLTPATGLSLGAGPYVAWLMNNPAYSLKHIRHKNHLNTYLDAGEADLLHRLDIGLSLSNSFEIRQKIIVRLQVDYGVRNLVKDRDDSMLRNQSFSCSMGYIICRRKQASHMH